jgi:deoxyribose-phosphate aldolase
MNTDELQRRARQALACLDLTSLNEQDSDADIERLCERAQSPQGPVAAVCVWPRFVALARRRLPAHIGVAAVANFPDGSSDIARAVADTHTIVQAGGNEVDVVAPYRALDAAPKLLQAVRAACPGLRLKVILETGELPDEATIDRACRIALDAGADFLKTSTGKVEVNATLGAADRLLYAIASSAKARGHVGFKPAGGIRTVGDAAAYMALVEQHLGTEAVNPQRFRIGASGLLEDILAVLSGRASAGSAAGY